MFVQYETFCPRSTFAQGSEGMLCALLHSAPPPHGAGRRKGLHDDTRLCQKIESPAPEERARLAPLHALCSTSRNLFLFLPISTW